jgi:low density lipoprotein receptor-related protein 5/6
MIEFGLESPVSLAVDWIADNLYWTDSDSNRIEVSRLDGSYRKTLIWKDLDNPHSIALNPSEGLMFWSDWGAIERIERSALDGTQRLVIVNRSGRASSLTIDYKERRLYWVDTFIDKILCSGLDGANPNEVIKSDQNNPFKPRGLTIYQDFIYWSNGVENTIERANKSNPFDSSVIQTKLDSVVDSDVDLVVYHNSRQSGWNPCAVNNGGCDHLCLALPSNNQRAYTHSCLCSSHYILNEDNKTCSGMS